MGHLETEGIADIAVRMVPLYLPYLLLLCRLFSMSTPKQNPKQHWKFRRFGSTDSDPTRCTRACENTFIDNNGDRFVCYRQCCLSHGHAGFCRCWRCARNRVPPGDLGKSSWPAGLAKLLSSCPPSLAALLGSGSGSELPSSAVRNSFSSGAPGAGGSESVVPGKVETKEEKVTEPKGQKRRENKKEDE